MLDSMKNEFGLVANTGNAGKWDWMWKWYEPPGGPWVPARRCIRGEDVLVTLLKNALWRVTGENPGGFGVIVSTFLSLELSEYTNIWVLRIKLRNDLRVNEI